MSQQQQQASSSSSGNNTDNESKEQRISIEHDQIRRDMIAAALLGPCKAINRELLRLRTVQTVSTAQMEATEQQLWKCVESFAQNFAEREGVWGSAMIVAPTQKPIQEEISTTPPEFGPPPIIGGNVGDIYYFERTSGKVQWDRPSMLDRLIREGKSARDQTEPIHDCEFLQTNFFICLRSTRAERSGCSFEHDKLLRCMRAKVLGNKK
ncbi:hypothetical protein FDP41_009191 [Naegleria fowleri]|uniref:WW domain-containing protein n=1 Tax=Naegleria fowleri TaxID=5763 RepID=A0A6A5BEB9_NAEFO|nr:uncharacterized protein FDP41_009191 [Naegleria fowleri]KAF0972288.1 hypothetical protein FDP41_009191 [Naegleria fowleri]CAG4719024.1 unnamed protein product [Naegleria fowleri]